MRSEVVDVVAEFGGEIEKAELLILSKDRRVPFESRSEARGLIFLNDLPLRLIVAFSRSW